MTWPLLNYSKLSVLDFECSALIFLLLSWGFSSRNKLLLLLIFVFPTSMATLVFKALLLSGVVLPFMSPVFSGAHITVVAGPPTLSHNPLLSTSLTHFLLCKCLN